MPIYVTVMYSLKTNSEYIKGVWALPKNPQWHYYTAAFLNIKSYMLNSLLVCVLTTAGVVLFSSMTAYVFSRHEFFGKNFLFALVMALMMVPSVLTMTPQFLIVLKLGI